MGSSMRAGTHDRLPGERTDGRTPPTPLPETSIPVSHRWRRATLPFRGSTPCWAASGAASRRWCRARRGRRCATTTRAGRTTSSTRSRSAPATTSIRSSSKRWGFFGCVSVGKGGLEEQERTCGCTHGQPHSHVHHPAHTHTAVRRRHEAAHGHRGGDDREALAGAVRAAPRLRPRVRQVRPGPRRARHGPRQEQALQRHGGVEGAAALHLLRGGLRLRAGE